MSRETGELIEEQVGKVLDVDLDENDSAMGEHMRIKVLIDITIPLMRVFTLIINGEEEHEQEREMEEEENDAEKNKKETTKIITFKYEHLPDFCYSCGIIGHSEKACPTKGVKGEERQFGAWMRAAIYKGASSEDGRSKSSSDRSGFWRSNSAGSKGSDAPSWRKNLPNTEGHKKINGGEGDVTSPLKIALGDQTEPTRGKKLVFEEEEEEERKSEPFSEREHKAGAGSEVTNETATQPCQHGGSERTHDGKGKKVEIEEREERLVQKSETKGKQTTFRRVNKPKGKQQSVPLVLGPKKRFAEYMEFDDEGEFSKKARMEIDGEEEG
uniref:CCHC-type domain-containing protein n=1 Tax=Triticum urartu TaxID=4572 RepID=A0A8R7TXG1_TRIUA